MAMVMNLQVVPRARRTMAEVLAEIPSYAAEHSRLRARLHNTCPMPRVLVDIVADYAPTQWCDNLIAIRKMASVKPSEYAGLIARIQGIALSADRAVRRQPGPNLNMTDSLACVIKMLNITQESGTRAQQLMADAHAMRAIIDESRVLYHAKGACFDPYGIDSTILESLHKLMLIMGDVGRFSQS